ncbi:hypothetical protein [Planctomycetes bacterium K23_9]|uniref:Lactonase, 7-bladed beta-propeller n=1 Tax=Stieleria marina TaxID=1930275 RepID=A0A517NYB8_9BACT|nr:hypothetical protein K239x_41210 [Planctomycetes bacterium K23_9]
MRLFMLCPLVAAVVASTVCPTSRSSAAEVYGLDPGPVELQSVGPMIFGPSNVLFIGDPKAAKVYALNTEDSGKSSGEYDIADITSKVATALNVDQAAIVDLAVNPETRNAYVGINAGGKGHLARIAPDGTVTRLNLDKIGHAIANLPNPPEDKVVKRGRRSSNPRDNCITDIAYNDGKVIVAGLSADEAPSAVREFEFPFREEAEGIQVEIYHAAHGRDESNAAIQAFVPFNIGGEPNLLAGFTCTPLVKIPIAKIGSSEKVKGTTLAELGNRNRPLDMIVYSKDGEDFLLMANSARGVMKISTGDLERDSGLTEKVSGGGSAGQDYETIASLKDVVQLDKIDDGHALVMIQSDNGPASLKTIDLP